MVQTESAVDMECWQEKKNSTVMSLFYIQVELLIYNEITHEASSTDLHITHNL